MAMGERIRFSGSAFSFRAWRMEGARYAVITSYRTRCTTNYCTQSNRREKLCVSRLFSQTVSFDYVTVPETRNHSMSVGMMPLRSSVSHNACSRARCDADGGGVAARRILWSRSSASTFLDMGDKGVCSCNDAKATSNSLMKDDFPEEAGPRDKTLGARDCCLIHTASGRFFIVVLLQLLPPPSSLASGTRPVACSERRRANASS